MRISDWSSDVCSSDLQCPDRLRRRVRDRQDPGPLTGVFALNSYLRGMTAAAGAEVKAVLRRTAIRAGLLVFAFLLLAIALQEIGRASCRERWCQYVWISVVAGSLKKKIHKTKT